MLRFHTFSSCLQQNYFENVSAKVLFPSKKILLYFENIQRRLEERKNLKEDNLRNVLCCVHSLAGFFLSSFLSLSQCQNPSIEHHDFFSGQEWIGRRENEGKRKKKRDRMEEKEWGKKGREKVNALVYSTNFNHEFSSQVLSNLLFSSTASQPSILPFDFIAFHSSPSLSLSFRPFCCPVENFSWRAGSLFLSTKQSVCVYLCGFITNFVPLFLISSTFKMWPVLDVLLKDQVSQYIFCY